MHSLTRTTQAHLPTLTRSRCNPYSGHWPAFFGPESGAKSSANAHNEVFAQRVDQPPVDNEIDVVTAFAAPSGFGCTVAFGKGRCADVRTTLAAAFGRKVLESLLCRSNLVFGQFVGAL